MRSIVYMGLLLVLGACGSEKTTMNEKDLYAFIRDEHHGLTKKQDVNEFEVTLMYKPSDLIAKQQMNGTTQREFDSLAAHFSNYLYFTLEMTYEKKDLESAFAADPGSFADKISYLSAGMTEQIQLITPSDTLAVLDYVYARSYGQGTSQCLLVFEKPAAEEFDIAINGAALGFGRLLFPFQQKDIKSTPTLKPESI